VFVDPCPVLSPHSAHGPTVACQRWPISRLNRLGVVAFGGSSARLPCGFSSVLSYSAGKRALTNRPTGRRGGTAAQTISCRPGAG
jgi:hypothetical protein